MVNRCDMTSLFLYEETSGPSERGSNLLGRFRGRGFPGGLRGPDPYYRWRPKDLGGRYADYEPEWYDPRGYDDRLPPGYGRKRKPGKSGVPRLPLAPWRPPLPLRKMLRLHPWFRLMELLNALVPPPPLRGGRHDMTGWSLICDTQAGPKTQWKVANFDPGLPCGLGGQVYDGDIPEGDIGPFPGNRRWIAFGRYAPIGPVGRMILDEQWSRPPSPDKVPWLPRWRMPPLPDVYVPPTWVDPLPSWPHTLWPPAPPPFKLIPDRRRKPPIVDEDTWFGNGLVEPPDPDPPLVNPQPPVPKPLPTPPGPNVKEKKAFGPVKKRILDLWDLATETEDAVDCLIDQLGKKAWKAYKRKNPEGTKYHFLWENWDKIDAAEGLMCMLRNNSTDRIVGGINRAARKHGLGFGFGGTPYRRTLK